MGETEKKRVDKQPRPALLPEVPLALGDTGEALGLWQPRPSCCLHQPAGMPPPAAWGSRTPARHLGRAAFPKWWSPSPLTSLLPCWGSCTRHHTRGGDEQPHGPAGWEKPGGGGQGRDGVSQNPPQGLTGAPLGSHGSLPGGLPGPSPGSPRNPPRGLTGPTRVSWAPPWGSPGRPPGVSRAPPWGSHRPLPRVSQEPPPGVSRAPPQNSRLCHRESRLVAADKDRRRAIRTDVHHHSPAALELKGTGAGGAVRQPPRQGAGPPGGCPEARGSWILTPPAPPRGRAPKQTHSPFRVPRGESAQLSAVDIHEGATLSVPRSEQTRIRLFAHARPRG